MSELRFDGQVAVVTGAGRGIGRGHALLLASRGASVVVNDAGVGPDGGGASAEPAESVVAEIQSKGGKAVASIANVASEEGARHIVDTALNQFGRIDTVINNAGIYRGMMIDQFDPELFRRHLDVHVLGSALVLRAAWPHLVASKGRVVNTMSASIFGMVGYTAYGAAKGGILGLTRNLAVEARPVGVKVNCIAPGAATRLMWEAMPGIPEDMKQRMEANMSPEAIAPVAAFLAHQDCDLNGECLAVAGRQVTRYVIAETDGIFPDEVTPEVVRDQLAAIMDTRKLHYWTDTETSVRRPL